MIPSSTYRIQFGPGMGFTQAKDSVAPYLQRLGVGALYASPLLQATPGSTHGYDVTDPTSVSAGLGGALARQLLQRRLAELGMGLVVDIVPNHVGIAVPQANPWWWDVLRYGRESVHAAKFDIDWSRGPLLVPVLGDDGLDDLRVEHGDLVYYEHMFPLAPGTEGGTPQEVHERQHYRLVHWRTANTDLNYRRFFDITTLAAVRVEDPDVFEATHREVLSWGVDGLRIDHPDGLSDPGGYLRRLRDAAPEAWIVVEKILGVGESLPVSWPVAGTTGYDGLREVCGLFIDPAGEPPNAGSLQYLENRCKVAAARTMLRAEVRRINALLPFDDEEAVIELLSMFPVYRSYLPEGREALEHAAAANPQAVEIAKLMLADPHGELATRVQQTSGMVMAKGVEDTAFYRYNRFVALNEVGGDPSRFGVSPAEFHAAMQAREAGSPTTMTALSTHDTKRSEDVRARLAALSEVDFETPFGRWTERKPLPERSLTRLAWQTLVGAFPISGDRLRDYLAKAAKEAKLVTSWVDANPEVDKAIEAWPEDVLGDATLMAEVAAFVARITPAGWSNSLGQKLVQLAGPGVPDVYQGTELWDFSLVDPDNRRPVDFELRKALLARIDDGWLPEIDATGAAKLLVTTRVLRLRRDRPELFTGYRPVPAQGPAAAHALAFARGENLVAVCTRLPIGLDAAGGWRDTVLPLPAGEWTDVITGRPVSSDAPLLSDLLSQYPVALAVRS
ncbi:malto-oligosyltrehalose synthase [Kutzneria buriramensis]|uniref:(1->4)-alpha-D-glucan 1-alpha-D-glucosylmutase n=1 Tax=Kutzneria buriramensis TaxID=1045776 RepID=A0A3E0I5W7_9PSEU|nr:malto-oligosyltrehalose synthase [Kutzneria buriramensis]REH54144.1 (1->4)-alpha-D-glucan 1-alpha-D-glucosylmutase [Kutzneria buriramensis]